MRHFDHFYQGRSTSGNISATFLVVLGVILLCWITFFSFNCLYFAHERLVDQAERADMFIASSINEYDRVGQINNMVAASRQLVFNSRLAYEDVNKQCPEVLPLATALMDESRVGAQRVIEEQDRVSSDVSSEIEYSAGSVGELNGGLLLAVWWLHMSNMIVNSNSGYIAGVDSNVTAPIGNLELMEMDQQYVNPKSGLYYGNITLSLPSPDSDIDFRLSSLPAPVHGVVAPARLLNNAQFRSGDQYIPSAVQATASVQCEGPFGKDRERTIMPMTVVTTAATNGACPMP